MHDKQDLSGEPPVPYQKEQCAFCLMNAAQVVEENRSAVALLDGYPISPGHTLVIPKRHVGSLFDLSAGEIADVWQLVGVVRARQFRQHHPDGFNIGLNDGVAAGQTIMHAHVHVVPRYKGDVADPRGGIRWILPNKAKYW